MALKYRFDTMMRVFESKLRGFTNYWDAKKKIENLFAELIKADRGAMGIAG